MKIIDHCIVYLQFHITNKRAEKVISQKVIIENSEAITAFNSIKIFSPNWYKIFGTLVWGITNY